MRIGPRKIVSAWLVAVALCSEVPRVIAGASTSSENAEASEYEGLVLLKRYARAAELCAACDSFRPGILPLDMPTARQHPSTSSSLLRDPVEWVLETNRSAVVFDFTGGFFGIGNCLYGFLQAFHMAVMTGLPLFILSHPTGTANAFCSVFECGFPVVTSELLSSRGSQRLPFRATVSDAMQPHSNVPFKVVNYRSNGNTAVCLKDAFSPPVNQACSSKSKSSAAVCWQAAVLRALMPRLSRAALLRLPTLRDVHIHGDFGQLLALAQSETAGAAVAPAMRALHVRTLNPKIENYGYLKSDKSNHLFDDNLKLLVTKSDFCTFFGDSNTGNNSSHNNLSSSSRSSRNDQRYPEGTNRDVLVASDSLALKESLAARWEPLGWRLHFFTTAGARLTTVPRPAYGFKSVPEAETSQNKTSEPGPSAEESGTLFWWSEVGGSAAQFCTLLEFWLLAHARPLVASTFFDIRLATASATKYLEQQITSVDEHGRVLSRELSQTVDNSHSALSTFAKVATIRGGLAATAALSQCHSTGSGHAPTRVARPGSGACSSECHGAKTVFNP